MVVMPVEGFLSAAEYLGPAMASAGPKATYTLIRNSGEPIYLISNSLTHAECEEWLYREGFSGWQSLITKRNHPLSWPEWKLFSVKNMQSSSRIHYYIDSDYKIVSKVAKLGITCMLHVDPFKPTSAADTSIDGESTYESWPELVDSIESSRAQAAKIEAKLVSHE